jgi:hypothetical protein
MIAMTLILCRIMRIARLGKLLTVLIENLYGTQGVRLGLSIDGF